nr:nucleotide-binding protein [Acaryochloris sp. IP29b_bin.137]
MLLKEYGLAEVRTLGQSFDGPTGAVIDRITAKGYRFLENTNIDLTRDNSWENSLQNSQQKLVQSHMDGNKIFIGHGRSKIWLELSNFLSQRLKLEWDEFNREPSAGQTTQQRLQDMLDKAAFAFLIMTAEDVDQDGKYHARANVIHEAGLFQGRLGFQKAIILLEEGCTEFSNIQGLTQIRFPKANILAKSEDIRAVLEREGILM